MNRPSPYLALTLTVALCLTGGRAESDDKVVGSVEMDQAISKALRQEDASRKAVTALLQRDDVQTIAENYGLDTRRAEAAVGTLQGDELARVAALAASADSQLAGGMTTVHISLVAALLIVIIIILLVD